ncbi:MAG: dihydroorotate dehydrogenase-like protein [Bacteroidales bacterium]|nr:dihydroorotate dehydrogenase-like protein [Bacteroidales bacterium]
MANLQTSYLGLKLKNPIIVSSSALTNSVEKIKKLEEKGAAAVVLKSLFEEQINYETSSLLQHKRYPEASDYILHYAKDNTLNEYLNLIKEAKASVSIPVIASINCVSEKDWTKYAADIEEAGADALELNIHIVVSNRDIKSKDIEQKYIDILKNVKEETDLPVAVKIGCHFTNIGRIVDRLNAYGAEGVVLFNRFYEPDIDINNLKFTSGEIFSNPSDIRHSLRWVGITSNLIPNIEISASTGVHDGEAAIKMLLAGAQSVQVCSTLYKHGIDELTKIIQGISDWMDNKNYEKIADFRGIMSYREIKDPAIYERAQFMKYFSSVV